MENKSFEQLIEDMTRQITANRHKILDDFFKAYASELACLEKDFSLDDICIVEQERHYRNACITRRYWFEFKPKFQDSEENKE